MYDPSLLRELRTAVAVEPDPLKRRLLQRAAEQIEHDHPAGLEDGILVMRGDVVVGFISDAELADTRLHARRGL